jgi:uncharacterized phage protein (TIGR01671 family)
MQYTGLKDKTGREIYEGDIIEGKLFHDGGTLPTMGVVEFDSHHAAFCLRNHGGQTLFHNHDVRSFDVIGNIFENPELLK